MNAPVLTPGPLLPAALAAAGIDPGAAVLDLYAGAGGWDEGARSLGLVSLGLEIWEPAIATATAAGHARVRCDIATLPTLLLGRFRKIVGSPPCQAWSQAGKQLGRLDRARVHALVDAYARGERDAPWPDGWHDGRSHHAAQPVRWIRDLRPDWVCLEQVPEVLDLWQHIAIVLRGWGYRVWTGKLNTANYGVPQTRKRAVLIARLGAPVHPPEPTHEEEPDEGALFGCREKWVSMGEALGWVPGAVATGTNSKISTAGDTRPYERDTDRPAPTLTGNVNRWNRIEGKPAPTVTGGSDGTTRGGVEVFAGREARARVRAERERADEWVLVNGRQARSTERGPDEPAGTIYGGRSGNLHWSRRRPATTVVGDERIAAPGHRDRAGGENQNAGDMVKVTLDEAAALQTFPRGYPWQGTKNERFLQVGNAIPPVLAARVIAAAEGRWAA